MTPTQGVDAIPAIRRQAPGSETGSNSAWRITAGSRFSLIQPDRRQILVDEMAWADLPALHVRPVRHGAIPIGDPHRVRLGIEDISLEFSHQRALPGGVRLV